MSRTFFQSRRSARSVVMALASLAIAACSTDQTVAPTELATARYSQTAAAARAIASVRVTPSAGAINVAATVQLTATAYDANGNVVDGGGFKWTTIDATTATVSASGLVTGVTSGGPVIITAKPQAKGASSSIKGTASITVNARPVAWVSVPSPTTQPLYAVWGAAPNNVWAAGEYGTILHWDGTVWTPFANPVYPHSITRMWGFAANDIWANGYTPGGGGFQDYHFDGTSWSYVRDGLNGPIWGIAANDVWFTGEFGIVAHYDGTQFTNVANPLQGAAYQTTGTASNDVWMVAHGNGGPTTMHWDGASWTGVAAPALDRLWAAWAASSTDVWATGSADASGQTPITIRWNGTQWSTVAVPAFVGPGIMYGMWGVHSSANTTNVFSVGSTGQIVMFDGSQWVAQPSTTTQTLWAVWGTSATDVWAVGAGGVILHRTFVP